MSEASLSFLGFGLPIKVPELGRYAQQWKGAEFMEQAPLAGALAGAYASRWYRLQSLNMFGDAMRDLLDPRLRGGEG